MTQFEKMITAGQIKCDICGKPMLSLPGGGWDNDRIICSDMRVCGAEIVFPTSTEIEDDIQKETT